MQNFMQENEALSVSFKDLFSKYHKVYATAESLTAGLISSTIVNTPGSSSWFDRGFVTYSNEAKMELLGVSAKTLKTKGAVSDDTAKQMVLGALKNSHADIAVAVTGIAGPDGGSAQKPVGTVWIGVADKTSCYVKCFVFTGNRESVRDQTVNEALKALIALTKGIEPFKIP